MQIYRSTADSSQRGALCVRFGSGSGRFTPSETVGSSALHRGPFQYSVAGRLPVDVGAGHRLYILAQSRRILDQNGANRLTSCPNPPL